MPRLLCIFSNSAVHLFSCKYVTMKLSRVELSCTCKECASTVMSMSVCVSVCLSVHEDISGTTRAIYSNFLCMLPVGCGSVLLPPESVL